jgi:Flp pilus assembly protein TadG
MPALQNRNALKRQLRRFRRNRRGSAALEFALVAPLFFGMLFAILETGLMFFADQTLETATQDVSRLVFTGQAQNAGYTQAQFKDQVCARIHALFNCDAITYDVQTFASFSSVDTTTPINTTTNQYVPTNKFDVGGPGDVVLVRVFYEWPLYVTALGFDLSNLGDGKRLLVATAAFRNEPYK